MIHWDHRPPYRQNTHMGHGAPESLVTLWLLPAWTSKAQREQDSEVGLLNSPKGEGCFLLCLCTPSFLHCMVWIRPLLLVKYLIFSRPVALKLLTHSDGILRNSTWQRDPCHWQALSVLMDKLHLFSTSSLCLSCGMLVLAHAPQDFQQPGNMVGRVRDLGHCWDRAFRATCFLKWRHHAEKQQKPDSPALLDKMNEWSRVLPVSMRTSLPHREQWGAASCPHSSRSTFKVALLAARKFPPCRRMS